MQVDLDLVRKHNLPGPRYTSYPPATHFTAAVDRIALLERIRESGRRQSGLSLYFHIPFCWSLCWYCGCHTVITTRQGDSSRYLRQLERELGLYEKIIPPERPVEQLHWGGGTPTFLLPEEIRALGRSIRRRFSCASDWEAGVEIDPRRLTLEHVSALREAGFNRASLGVQDHNPAVQKAAHRIQPREATERAIGWIRGAGFQSVNIDLIYGLPKQTPESFARTLEDTLEFAPDRFAVFSYAHVPWVKAWQKIFNPDELPGPEMKLELLKLTIETLTRAGYVYVGMDHFARADDELARAQRNKTLQRNFQGYSTRGGLDIYGFGISSISQADGVYWQNIKELPAYESALAEGQFPIARGYILTPEDRIRRKVIARLMCDLSLDFGAISREFDIDFESHFADELADLGDLIEDGLVARDAGGLTVTERGRLFIRNIAMRFDAYLRGAAAEGRYSKTI